MRLNHDHSILFISGSGPDHGGPHQLMPAIWLARKGRRVICMCPGDNRQTAFTTPLGAVDARFIPGRCNRLGLLWHLRLLGRLLKFRWRAPVNTIFYVHGSLACPAASLALQFAWRRVAYHTQDYLEPGRHPHWQFFEKWVARRARYVICNEPNRARFMASHYRLGSVPAVVRTGLPREWPTPDFDTALRRRMLAKIGRESEPRIRLVMLPGGFSEVRCGTSIIRAMQRLPDRYVLVVSTVAPENPAHARYAALAEQAGLGSRIIRLDKLSYDALLQHMAACDLGMMLYADDGIGNFYQAPGKLPEYLGCGLPYVTSNFPGLELITLKYRLGEVCDPSSPSAIAGAIQKLGEAAPEVIAARRHRLKRLAKTVFAYESESWRIEQVCDDLAVDARSS